MAHAPPSPILATTVTAQTFLGDSHNFGRRVALRGARVEKPRTLLWEWLLLGATSPLRRLLEHAAESDGLGADTFAFLPTLRFYPTRKLGGGGAVERITLEPLRQRLGRAARRELAEVVGRALALFSWLGVADLHWENLVLGVDARGRTVFGPLDVEMILADLALPTETKLLPDADPEYRDICRHAAGVRRVLPYLGKPVDPGDLVAMAASYQSMLAFLGRHARAIAEIFSSAPGMRAAPIRVCLRSTGEYLAAGSTPLWPPLLDAEFEQLDRGDIPYFFRLYGRPGIHYYGDRALRRICTLPLKGDVPQLDPILSLSRGLRAPSRQRLATDGLFALLGAFDHPSFSGRHEHGSLGINFAARSLAVRSDPGQELRTRRDLSSFVSSVYLPCRCGEVRSVFVPPVTVCRPARRVS